MKKKKVTKAHLVCLAIHQANRPLTRVEALKAAWELDPNPNKVPFRPGSNLCYFRPVPLRPSDEFHAVQLPISLLVKGLIRRVPNGNAPDGAFTYALTQKGRNLAFVAAGFESLNHNHLPR